MRKLLLATTALFALSSTASAEVLKFYSGQNPSPDATPYSGQFANSAMHQFTKGLATNCNGGGSSCAHGSDIRSNTQSFTGGVTASANGTQQVWADLTPNYAGLGVGGALEPDTADQIVGTDVLHLHFGSAVTLFGIETLFDIGHDPFGSFNQTTDFTNMTFLVGTSLATLNSTTFGTANGGYNYGSSSDWYFEQNGVGNPGFYVSAIAYSPLGINPLTPAVPEPATWFMMILGFLGVGLVGMRRRGGSRPFRIVSA